MNCLSSLGFIVVQDRNGFVYKGPPLDQFIFIAIDFVSVEVSTIDPPIICADCAAISYRSVFTLLRR